MQFLDTPFPNADSVGLDGAQERAFNRFPDDAVGRGLATTHLREPLGSQLGINSW